MAAKKMAASKASARPSASAFLQVFKNGDDILHKDAGCTSELDYTEQSSWLLFLKYLDALEEDRQTQAQLEGKKSSYILDKKYRWGTWAAPRNKAGDIDYNEAMTGKDLVDFVNGELFPYRQGFKQRAGRARQRVAVQFTDRARNFIDFVLDHYVAEGVEELQPNRLAPLLELRFRSVTEALDELGMGADDALETFRTFQKHLCAEAV